MLSLPQIARALNGKVSGRQVVAAGPGHSHRDQSLSVRLSVASPDGFLVHSHAGDDWRVCRDYVADRLGLSRDRWRDQQEPDPAQAAQREERRRRAEESEAAADARRQIAALRIWKSGHDPRGSVVETYLASRRLIFEPDIFGEVLRFVERCPWGEGATVPAMVAAMRCVRTGEIKAIHRTALTHDARKIGRKMLGPTAGAAVMIDPEEAVSTGLAIGEGIESCLAARQLGIRPVWALGSTGGIAGFPVLPGIETLTLLVENDANGASEQACRRPGDRWHQAGRAVDVVRPRLGKDLNDTLMMEGASA